MNSNDDREQYVARADSLPEEPAEEFSPIEEARELYASLDFGDKPRRVRKFKGKEAWKDDMGYMPLGFRKR